MLQKSNAGIERELSASIQFIRKVMQTKEQKIAHILNRCFRKQEKGESICKFTENSIHDDIDTILHHEKSEKNKNILPNQNEINI